MATKIHGLGGSSGYALGKSGEINSNVFKVVEPDYGPTLFIPLEISPNENGDDIIRDESDPAHAILKEIYTFLKSADKYKKFKVPHKRGIVLYGPPGTGKTVAVKLITKLFIEQTDGWVISNAATVDLGNAVSLIRDQDKSRPILLVFDDMRTSNSDLSYLLQFMDGQEERNNIIFLFTTNYFHEFPEALKRPSRTDLHVKITGMSDKAAAGYCLKKFEDSNFEEVKKAFSSNKIALTYAVLKEVMLLKHIYGMTPDAAINRIRNSGCNFMTEADNEVAAKPTAVSAQELLKKLYKSPVMATTAAKRKAPPAEVPAEYTSESDNS